MTKEEFLKKCEELEARGYRKNFKYDEQINPNGTHYFYKVIEKAYDKYDDYRAINQLMFKVWHFEDFSDRVPAESMYSFQPVVLFSRDTDERIDLNINFPEHSIEYLEQKAKEFGDWCKEHMSYK